MSVGTELDAVVIGSGPNGLAAAITIAREGGSVLIVEAADTIGGGLHSAELTLPGLTHDLCSTIHTLGAGSPFMRSLPLEEYGVEWVHPEVLLAHPVSPSEAGLLHRSVDATADGLGPDADRYRSLVGTVVERWEHLEENVLGPILSWPRHPVDLVRFGLRAMLPMTTTAARMKTEKAAALLAGCAAHAFLPLTRPFTTAFALTLTATGHRYGWPFVRGGSQALANAMARYLEDLGGKIETGRRIEDLAELPRSRIVLADVSPPSLARLLEGRVPETFLRRYRRFRPSPGAFKVDYALTEPVPWSNPDLARAGTIHLGGSATAIAAAESATWSGREAARPFTLVCQPSIFDSSRTDGRHHTLWAYAHVPNGSTTDFVQRIEALITEMAPGFPDVVAGRRVHTPADLEAANPNLIGGDITGGAHTVRQLVFRPAYRLDPYTTPLDRVFLCSSSTPPGGGTHGMSGHLAASSAIRRWL